MPWTGRLRTAAGRVGRSVRWYVRGVVQEDAYERYLEHLGRVHPGAEPQSRKQFWKDRIDARDANPTSRCC